MGGILNHGVRLTEKAAICCTYTPDCWGSFFRLALAGADLFSFFSEWQFLHLASIWPDSHHTLAL